MTAKKTRRAMSKAKKAIEKPEANRKAKAGQLSHSEIEEMVLDLIEEHFDEKHRDAAREWFVTVAAFYQVFLETEAKLSASGSPQGMR